LFFMDMYVVKFKNDITFAQVRQLAKNIKKNAAVEPAVPEESNAFMFADKEIAEKMINILDGVLTVISYGEILP